MPLTAIALNCSLKKSLGEASSTDAMIAVLKEHLAEQDVELAETIRIADYNVPPGVTSNEGEGEGDDWPAIREKILSHDILVFGGPIWMGQIGSVRQTRARTHGCLHQRNRWPRPDAELRQGGDCRDRRQ